MMARTDIPSDWQVLPLGQLAQLERGKFSARPRNDPRYYGGDIPFIQTGDVRKSGVRITSYSQTLNERGLKVSKLFPAGTLFMTIAANIGDLGISQFASACPDSLVAIRPVTSVDRGWLYYVLNAMKTELKSIATQNAQANLNLAKLNPLPLIVPPFAQQVAISTALDDVSQSIAVIERLIAKKQAIKQGMLQQLLTGKTRLPGFTESWGEVRLRDVGDTYGGLSGKAKDDFGSGSGLFVTFMEVMESPRLAGRRIERVNVRPTERQNQVERGDVLFNGSSETPEEVALAAVVDFDPSPTTFLNSFCFGYRLKRYDLLNPSYLAYFFRSGSGRALVSPLAQGAIRYNIAKTKFLDVAPMLPPLDEQIAIVDIVRDAENDVRVLEKRAAKARAIKQGMVQQLLAGRTRLPVAESTQ